MEGGGEECFQEMHPARRVFKLLLGSKSQRGGGVSSIIKETCTKILYTWYCNIITSINDI